MRRDNEKMNNKGFSLVELIIVIAIMAVLVAVLAPQFTKYVDRSRQSNDATTVSGIVTAAEVAVADMTDYTIEPAEYTITLSKDAAAVVKKDNVAHPAVATPSPTSPKNMTNAIIDACGALDSLKVTANKWKTVTVTMTVSNSAAVTVTYSSTDKANTVTNDFSTYINGTPTPTP